MLKVALLRNILLLSVLIAFSLPLYETYFIQPSYRQMLLKQTEQEAIRYGHHLIRSLALDQQLLQRGYVPVGIAEEVATIRDDHQLIKLRVFSAAGEIVYSTQGEEVGQTNQKDYFVDIVAKGHFYSKVVVKDSLTAEGQATKIDVIETYVPIMGADGFSGALEIYFNFSSAISSLEAISTHSNRVLIAIVTGLFLTIIISLSRAYASHCAQQHSEEMLLEINLELDQRVSDRTRDLKLANVELQATVQQHMFTSNELKRANEFNRTIINSFSDAVAIIDVESHRVVDCNAAFLAARPALEDVRGRTCFSLTRNSEAPCSTAEGTCPLVEMVRTGTSASAEHCYTDATGNLSYAEVTTSPILDDAGIITQAVHVWRDITQRKLAGAEVLKMAYYDALTGLPNRRMLLDRLQQAIPRERRKQGKLALLFLDLDRFKDINDSRGHSCGDQVLQAVAGRLSQIVRESDTLARLGGDEFVFLLTEVETDFDASVVADKILDAIRQPIRIDESQVHITTSIGISIFPNDGEDSEVLLKGADIALYAAKSLGRNVYKFFSDKMNSLAQQRHELESRMHQALDDGEFTLVYQPQINSKTGQIIGFEALARWHNRDLGSVPPDRFIPLAEETGLIQPLGDWVLESACRQAKEWLEYLGGDWCVAVNISARQFRQPDFVATVKRVLAETGLPAGFLELELTESLLMQNVEDNIAVLQQLKGLGLRLSIDDFGTGYSSLSYLKHFPIDRIKIDKSFVQDIINDENDLVIVETIIAMAERLGLEVIAEGVETQEQCATLQARNCHLLQGFLYAQPMSPAELQSFMQVDRQQRVV